MITFFENEVELIIIIIDRDTDIDICKFINLKISMCVANFDVTDSVRKNFSYENHGYR